MLKQIDYLQPALEIPYCHHEKWDGTGYPRGLSGEQIPISARIFAVVDVFDALSNDRPYRRAMSRAEVVEFMRTQSGKYFDPNVVDVFIRMLNSSH
jgi:putative two-component system response regulator